MKNRVVKFDRNAIYHNLENFWGFYLSTRECQDKEIQEGKVTLSIKKGKSRKLVRGQIKIDWEFSQRYDSYDTFYYFQPNNRAKFLSVLGTSEQSK